MFGLQRLAVFSNPTCLVSLFSFVRHKHHSINPKASHFVGLLNLCRTSEDLKPLKSFLLVHGLINHVSVTEQFFRSCFHLGASHLALSTFQQVKRPSLGLQNLMIRCLCNNGLYQDLLCVYLSSRVSGCPSDDFTFPFVIKACAALGAVKIGKEVHGVVFRTGFEQNLVIQTSLVDLYARTGGVEIARHVIDRIPQPDLVPWNALIAGYSSNGFDWEALDVFREIVSKDLKPNLSTLASIVPVCTRLGCIPAVVKNVAVWNAMISAYTQRQKPVLAFELFRWMLLVDIQPNLVTFVSIIPSCAL